MRAVWPDNPRIRTPERELGELVARSELVGVQRLPERPHFARLSAALIRLGRRFHRQLEILKVAGRLRVRAGQQIVAPVNRWVVFAHDWAYGSKSCRADDLLSVECIVCDPFGNYLEPGMFVVDFLRQKGQWMRLPAVGDDLKADPTELDEMIAEDEAAGEAEEQEAAESDEKLYRDAGVRAWA